MSTPTPAPTLALTPLELFSGCLEIASRSFGGAAAWARAVVVERRGWLDDAQFTEAWGLALSVPGPNVINLVVHLGDRAAGPRGSLAAFAGIMLVPTALAVAIDAFLMRWIHIPAMQQALLGLGAAAAGLVWAMGLKMGARFQSSPVPLGLALGAFVAAGPLQAPLPLVVLLFGPPGVLWAWRRS